MKRKYTFSILLALIVAFFNGALYSAVANNPLNLLWLIRDLQALNYQGALEGGIRKLGNEKVFQYKGLKDTSLPLDVINGKDSFGDENTLLHLAIVTNHCPNNDQFILQKEVVDALLLRNESLLNGTNNKGVRPLKAAIDKGKEADGIVAYLIEKHYLKKPNEIALFLANNGFGIPQAIEKQMFKTMNILAGSAGSQYNFSYYLKNISDDEMLSTLIKNQEVNVPDDALYVYISEKARSGKINTELFKEICERNTKVLNHTVQNKTLLYEYICASSDGSIEFNEEIFKILLSNGASIAEKSSEDKNGCGYTILHQAFKDRGDRFFPKNREFGTKVIELCIKHAGEENIRNALLVKNPEEFLTPLHLALQQGVKNKAFVERFLKIAASGNDEFKRKFKTDVLDILARVLNNNTNYVGVAPLHLAVEKGFEEPIIKKLLNLGANPLQEDEPPKGSTLNKRTPLQYAVDLKRGNDIVSTLKVAAEAVKKTALPPVTNSQPLPDPKIAKPTLIPPGSLAASSSAQSSSSTQSNLLSTQSGDAPAGTVSPPLGASSGKPVDTSVQQPSSGSHISTPIDQENRKTDEPVKPSGDGTSKGTLSPSPTNGPSQENQTKPSLPIPPQPASLPSVPKDSQESHIGIPTGKPVNSTSSTNPDSSYLAGSDGKSGHKNKVLTGGALIGIPLILIGITYGIKKMLKNAKKQTNEHYEVAEEVGETEVR